jgi:hypothetical protein
MKVKVKVKEGKAMGQCGNIQSAIAVILQAPIM